MGDYLLISIQRFNTLLNTKNTAFISFNEKLDISSFYDGIEDLNKINNYNLIATVNHYGTLNLGHYDSNIKIYNNWFNFNDNIISKLINLEFYSKNICLLVYKK